MLVKVSFTNTKGALHENITQGTEKAPDKILEALDDVWTNEQGKQVNVHELEIKKITNQKRIFEEAQKFLKSNEKIIFLGGDHSISYDLVRAFKQDKKQEIGLIVLDSHPDVIKQEKEINHENWLRVLIESGFDAKNIILAGVRASCIEENDFLKESGIRVYKMKDIYEDFQGFVEIIMEQARKFSSFYLSIDIDAVDPAFAPGVGYIEPGGLSSRELIYIVQHLALLKNLKAIDIVEVNPEKDINGITVKLAARIVAEML